MTKHVVDVWMTKTNAVTKELLQSYVKVLDESEYLRWQQFINPNAGLQYLVSHTLLRTALSRYEDVEPEVWRFGMNIHGRPFIKYPAGIDLNFNLSHTDGLTACAVTRHFSVGVDVEATTRNIDFRELADFSLNSTEACAVSVTEPHLRSELFLTYWTLKEAYAKALGLGLSIDFKTFYFDLSGDNPRIIFSSHTHSHSGGWAFFKTRPTNRHHLAVAVSCQEPVYFKLDWIIPAVPSK